AYGNALFDFIFGTQDAPNALYRYWFDSRADAAQTGDGLRLVLHLEDDKLIGVPWELLCRHDSFLGANPGQHTLVRSAWQAKPPFASSVQPPDVTAFEPLRVLLVLCSAPREDETISGPEELFGVDLALHQ